MSSFATLRHWLLAAGLLVGGAMSWLGCMNCNEPACGLPFQWRGDPLESIPPGMLRVEIDVEQSRYVVECTLGDLEASCAEPVRESGEQEFLVSMYLSADAVDLQISDQSGSDPFGAPSYDRGPSDVAVTLTLDDEVLTSVEYTELEYVRNDEFYGAPQCGFCDEALEFTHEW